jgi:SHS2 domain-containing protein
MSYRWVEHTAEVELHIEAGSVDAVFREALEALGELIGGGSAGERSSYEVTVAAPDRAALLAAWLDELVYRAETEDLVPDAIERLAFAGDSLTATVRAHRGQPRHYVKGVTYHALTFEAGDAGFAATVVLDV